MVPLASHGWDAWKEPKEVRCLSGRPWDLYSPAFHGMLGAPVQAALIWPCQLKSAYNDSPKDAKESPMIGPDIRHRNHRGLGRA